MINRLFKSTLLFINFILIGLLLVAYLSNSISPEVVPFFTVFSLFFPIIVILNFFAVVFWLVLKKFYFIFSLLTLVVGFNRINDSLTFIPQKTSDLAKTDFSLMSYNVRLFDLYNWTGNKISREQMFDYFRQTSPDIACFQEYYNTSSGQLSIHDSLMLNQRFQFAHLYYAAKIKPDQNFGNATYSCYPIIAKNEVIFENTQNLILVTDIKINDDTLRVFNCHFQSVKFLREDYQFMDSINKVGEKRRKKGMKGLFNRLTKAAIMRAQQAEHVAKLIENSPYPSLVCGDFNDVPSSYVYHVLSKNLSDSHIIKNIGVGGTYNRFFPSNRIDYILFNHKLQCNGYTRNKVYWSDHYPIFGKYSFVE